VQLVSLELIAAYAPLTSNGAIAVNAATVAIMETVVIRAVFRFDIVPIMDSKTIKNFLDNFQSFVLELVIFLLGYPI